MSQNRPETVSLPEPPLPLPRFQEITASERPQERLERHGPGALSDTELVAMLLRSGSARCDVLSLARMLMREAGSLAGLLRWSAEDFQRLPGIGKVKALQWITVLEVARRILMQQVSDEAILDDPSKVFAYLAPLAAGLSVEKCWVLCLDARNRLLRRAEVTSGTASASLVHPREIFREAIRTGASTIVVAHNHPSGDPSPSSADIRVTRQLREAAKVVDIHLADHIVIGRPSKAIPRAGYYSFADNGML